jgi:hypothetical protein
MTITKDKLIKSGISEKCISVFTCNKCHGLLVGQKDNTLVCVDCATSYKSV